MLASDGERLTWRPTCHHVNLAVDLTEVDPAHVFVVNSPVTNVLDATTLVLFKNRNGVGVEFDNQLVLKAGASQAKCEPPTPGKEFDATHPGTASDDVRGPLHPESGIPRLSVRAS